MTGRHPTVTERSVSNAEVRRATWPSGSFSLLDAPFHHHTKKRCSFIYVILDLFILEGKPAARLGSYTALSGCGK
ncbi:hypothetical protein ACINK0_08945 [Deinococcus sp. VB343]|uniref:hypothetical protein n=1 Tax=Deinococcus sp. VB343 TaxID=3385567 RepID=UPI0039C916AF